LLHNIGFSTIEYYNYKLKYTIKGRGWKIKPKTMNPVSTLKNSDEYINTKINELPLIQYDKSKILNKWYINSNFKILTYLYSLYHHHSLIKLKPDFNVGHEIFGLFKK
jgi:hypothetical protein